MHRLPFRRTHQGRATAWIGIALAISSHGIAARSGAANSRISLSAATSDWPAWNGPRGDLTSPGRGVFTQGTFDLEQVWSHPLGSAYSGILVVDGRLVTAFSDGSSDFLVGLDEASGVEQWRYRISDTYKGDPNADDGPLATPSVASASAGEGRTSGVVYGLGAWGGLFAVALADGQELWRHDLVANYGAIMPGAGFTTAPTVFGDLVVVETGGGEGRSISAFDRHEGTLRWSTGDDSVTYQSPLVLQIGGRESLVALTDRSLLGLDPETGAVLWQHRHTEGDGRSFLATQPIPVGDGGILLVDRADTALFQVTRSGEQFTVEEVWRSRALRSQGNFAAPVPHQGHLYGFSGNFLTCVDATTGERVWKSRPPGVGNLVLVDDHLVILVRSGEIVVAEASPEGYSEVSRVQALERGYFTRPSFANGKIFVRNLVDITAIGVTAGDSTAATGSHQAAAEVPELLGEFGAFVAELASAENKDERIEQWLASQPALPILEGNLVHFVFSGEVEDLAIAGNFIRDGREHSMHRVEGTDFYFRSYELPREAVFTYRFSVFDDRMTDPRNPRTTGPEGRQLSLLATSGWQPPAHLREPEGPRGTLDAVMWRSELLGNEREVRVYLPPGYTESSARYPLLIVNDGEAALSAGQMTTTLDNLIGETVAPMIVAFLPNVNGRELGGLETATYARAQAEELVPLLDASFRTDSRREARAVIGQDPYGSASFAAMYLALHQPETFSKVAVQSYEDGALAEELFAAVAGARHDLQLIFHWSSHDSYDPFFDFDARRDSQQLVAALRENGYSPTVFESDDGFGWGMWQGRMDEILQTLFPLP